MICTQDNGDVITPPLLQLSSANVDSNGAYLMDVGLYMYLWVGTNVSPSFCQEAFDKEDFNSMADCVVCIQPPPLSPPGVCTCTLIITNLHL